MFSGGGGRVKSIKIDTALPLRLRISHFTYIELKRFKCSFEFNLLKILTHG
jgi:hypothetical protein